MTVFSYGSSLSTFHFLFLFIFHSVYVICCSYASHIRLFISRCLLKAHICAIFFDRLAEVRFVYFLFAFALVHNCVHGANCYRRKRAEKGIAAADAMPVPAAGAPESDTDEDVPSPAPVKKIGFVENFPTARPRTAQSSGSRTMSAARPLSAGRPLSVARRTMMKSVRRKEVSFWGESGCINTIPITNILSYSVLKYILCFR
jgi:hypothetical protein